jgi:DNA-binding CsgD family transcriptional regulator
VQLHGRTAETAHIDWLLSRAYDGRSSVLAILGEAGIGKTSLLEYAAQSASGMRVLRATGIEVQAELPYAGLRLLLRGALDRLDELTPVQAEALCGALGQGDGHAGDRFLVGHAVLSLLADLAEDQPLLCLLDDAQWLDRASLDAVLFASRRLVAEGVVVLLAAHDIAVSGVRTLWLPGLGYADAVSVLATDAADLAPPVREWVVNAAGGNPLALIELPAMLSPDQRAGNLPTLQDEAGVQTAVGLVQQAFAARIAGLPASAQTLIQVAAADATGCVEVVLAAAAQLGTTPQDLWPAERARLVSHCGGTIRFRHPLIRAAAYRSTTPGRRHAIYRALASCEEDPDRRAWHLAEAATDADERVAVEVEHAAERAADRGSCMAAAAGYERAAALSIDPAKRARRLAAAAMTAADAGQPERAAGLADRAMPKLADPVPLARLAQIRAAAADAAGNPAAARGMLIDAARAAAGQAPDLVAVILLDAVAAAWDSCDMTAVVQVADVVRGLWPAPETNSSPAIEAILVLAEVAAERPQLGVPALHRLLAALRERGHQLGLRERTRIQGLDTLGSDPSTAHQLAVTLVRDCRAEGAIGLLPAALTVLARSQLLYGSNRDALATATEGLRLAQDTGQRHHLGQLTVIPAYLAAVEGDEERCRELASEATPRWSPILLAMLELGLGRCDTALNRLKNEPGGTDLVALTGLPILVEAAARVDELDRARQAAKRLESWAIHTGQCWPAAVALRCRALLAPDGEAEGCFQHALHVHPDGVHPFERARTHLLYGEWLRRTHRPGEAGEHLRAALSTFSHLNALPWAARARTELRASGDAAGPHLARDDPHSRLTLHELQAVRLAEQGLSNRDVAVRLMLGPRTVAYHLYKAYPKLAVTSHAQAALNIREAA